MARPSPRLSRLLREPVNSLTHLAGAVLSVLGLIVLLVLSAGEPWRSVSFAVYGSSLVLLYAASTLYHALHAGERRLRQLKRLDHIAIFALIAGTYTPITLVTLQQGHAAWGWAVFGAVWGFALLGVLFKLLWLGAPRKLYTALYLLMGWMSLIAIVPIAQAMPVGGLAWMGLGGLCYTVGAVVYALKRPNFTASFGFHELWHVFVLAGSACHFVMMLGYVLPMAG
jgi:hemolysin III